MISPLSHRNTPRFGTKFTFPASFGADIDGKRLLYTISGDLNKAFPSHQYGASLHIENDTDNQYAVILTSVNKTDDYGRAKELETIRNTLIGAKMDGLSAFREEIVCGIIKQVKGLQERIMTDNSGILLNGEDKSPLDVT